MGSASFRPGLVVLLAALVAAPMGAVPQRAARSHFVAPSPGGRVIGDGTRDRPWDLATALTGVDGQIQPGDTVWLLEGTYREGRALISRLAGAPGAPIVVRQHPGRPGGGGARAVIDVRGSTSTAHRGDAFVVTGAWTEWWGFELMSSDPDRATSSRPNLLVNNASHTKYINLVIHDGGIGFYTYPDAADVEIYGCVFYNNGWEDAGRGGGHALYLKSDAGPLVVQDNVVFNQFGYGIHAYTDAGSGALTNIRIEGNAVFNSGTLADGSPSANVLVGGYEPADAIVVRENFTFFPVGTGWMNVILGYPSTRFRNGTVAVLGNVIAGGTSTLHVNDWARVSVMDNLVAGPETIVSLKANAGGQRWTANRYYRDPAAAAWVYDGKAHPFAAWRRATGLGAADHAFAALPAEARVVVRRNRYEPGRAHVIVYNWPRRGTVSLSLSGLVAVGARYEIRNVQALSGAPVAAGTFTGDPIRIPMSGVMPPAPVGRSASRAPKTGPAFDVFVVTWGGK